MMMVKFDKSFLIVVFVTICQLINLQSTDGATYTPVVMYHGMGDTAHGSITSIKHLLERDLPGIYVTSIQMGQNEEEDFLSGFFMNLNTQVETACKIIRDDYRLKNGYHGLGFSQGGQILRAIAQRCPDPPMRNLITLGGQHQGVYGVPRCAGSVKICDYVREMINFGAYTKFVQQHIVQAQYWHDPLQEKLYQDDSIFLADINNQKIPRNESYKTNLSKLKNLVLVTFLNDTIVEPKESSRFGFYFPGQSQKIYDFRESPLYQQDWIGLKNLDEQNRLKVIDIEGDHLRFNKTWFQKEIVQKYLATIY